MERKSEKREKKELEGHTYSEFWTTSSALTIPVSDLVILSMPTHRGHPLTFWMHNDRLLLNHVKTAVNLDGSLIIIEAEMRHEGK